MKKFRVYFKDYIDFVQIDGAYGSEYSPETENTTLLAADEKDLILKFYNAFDTCDDTSAIEIVHIEAL